MHAVPVEAAPYLKIARRQLYWPTCIRSLGGSSQRPIIRPDMPLLDVSLRGLSYLPISRTCSLRPSLSYWDAALSINGRDLMYHE